MLRAMAAERVSITADQLRNQEDPSPFVSDPGLIESKIQFLQLISWTRVISPLLHRIQYLKL